MKTVVEWSKAFDILWNNIASGKAPGLNSYEKSLFLTSAENAMVKDYFSPNSNVWKEGFDDSIRRQADFKSLISSVSLSPVSNLDTTDNFRTRPNTRYFILPSSVCVIVNEEVGITGQDTSGSGSGDGGTEYFTVVPISSSEYDRLMMSPYPYPPKNQVWRIVSHTGTDGEVSYQTIELIGKFAPADSVDYRVRYVRRPKPIILEKLLGGLSIEGETEAMACELPEHLHDEILQRAVQIAKISWIDGHSDKTSQ